MAKYFVSINKTKIHIALRWNVSWWKDVASRVTHVGNIPLGHNNGLEQMTGMVVWVGGHVGFCMMIHRNPAESFQTLETKQGEG